MKSMDIALTYEANCTFTHPNGLEGDTRLTILIPEENEHKKLAIILHLVKDIEDTIIERFNLTRKEYEDIREAIL